MKKVKVIREKTGEFVENERMDIIGQMETQVCIMI